MNGSLKTYEAMLLLDNREVKKGWDTLKEQVDGVLQKNGADIVVAKRWDERKLAFEIKKQRRATYYLAYFKADTDSITGLRRALGLTAPVLRHMILACGEIPSSAYEPEREFEIDKPDPEDADKEATGATEATEAAEATEATSDAEAAEADAQPEEVASDVVEEAAEQGGDAAEQPTDDAAESPDASSSEESEEKEE